ncbi:MAG: TrmH family RNA methyltransferase [Pseudomonadota bacterium]
MRFAIVEPDMPANLGACLRLAAGFGLALDVVGPCGFPLDHARIKRAAMDYADLAELRRWTDFDAFRAAERGGRIILLTTKGDVRFDRLEIDAGDSLVFGSESRGAPDAVHAAADIRARLPLKPPARSFNLATAAAMALTLAFDRADMMDRLDQA